LYWPLHGVVGVALFGYFHQEEAAMRVMVKAGFLGYEGQNREGAQAHGR
jgi:hypothetical protein